MTLTNQKKKKNEEEQETFISTCIDSTEEIN